jgi:hypothetical protein
VNLLLSNLLISWSLPSNGSTCHNIEESHYLSLTRYYEDRDIKKDEIAGTCSTCVREEEFMKTNQSLIILPQFSY